MESMELKPCPFCGSENISITVPSNHGGWDGPPGYIVRCKKCFAEIDLQCSSKKDTIIKWNRRYEPPNPPLTLDELREMGGEPVWCVDGMMNQCWCLVNCDDDLPCCYDNEEGLWDGCFYGMEETWKHSLHPIGWLAYRRRPEEVQNEP